MTRTIELVPHDPAWLQQAQAEATRVTALLASNVLAVHHIGSTAIPGIKAKPILDLLVEVRDLERVDELNEQMIAGGYEPRGENGIPGRRYFVWRTGNTHTHHLHVFQRGHAEIERHLLFRDYLLAHPAQAQAYSRLKEQLAVTFREDPEGYTDGKSDFIREVDVQARGIAAGGGYPPCSASNSSKRG